MTPNIRDVLRQNKLLKDQLEKTVQRIKNEAYREAASVCERSERYRGWYFAAKVRELIKE